MNCLLAVTAVLLGLALGAPARAQTQDQTWIPTTRVYVGQSNIGPVYFARPTATRVWNTQDWRSSLQDRTPTRPRPAPVARPDGTVSPPAPVVGPSGMHGATSIWSRTPAPRFQDPAAVPRGP